MELAKGEPPNADIHPMRAIFKIPYMPAPTLPDPENWSPEFNDFLEQCLQKDVDARPTAAQLLKKHPFVAKAAKLGLGVMATLVNDSMAEIESFRTQEVQEAAEAEKNAVAAAATLLAGATVCYPCLPLTMPVATSLTSAFWPCHCRLIRRI